MVKKVKAKKTTRKVVVATVAVTLMAILALCLTACAIGGANAKADTVVYGNIYTSNNNQDVVEAAAIKDGKYVYVGDRDGAQAYVGDKTEVVDQQSGMVMAGGTEAHGHYICQSMEKLLVNTSASSLDQLKSDIKTYVEKHPDKTVIAGAGWTRDNDLAPNTDINYAKQLDEICSDKPVAIYDNDHHQIVANTKAMEEMFNQNGINMVDKEKGREDKESCTGGIILRLSDGTANGYRRDQAATAMAYCILGNAVSDEEYKTVMQDMQTTLYKQGYTNYNDGLTNVYGNNAFNALIKADKEDKINVCVHPNFCVFAYQARNSDAINAAVSDIETFYKQSSSRVLPSGIKLFVDGVTESATGLNDIPYVGTNNYGNEVLTEDQIYEVAKAANAKGISVHTHSYGNVAVQRTINAFIKAQNEVNNGTRNSMAHVRNVFADDYKRMSENNIAVAENINWGTTMTDALANETEKTTGIPASLQADAYPIKSLVDNGVVTGSSTDAPAANDCPTDVFGILEIAVDRTALSWINGMPESKQKTLRETGLVEGQLKVEDVTNKGENVDVKTGLDIMTINGAKLMGIGDTRGSIEVGKYADFVLVDKNVLDCPTNEIHSAKATKIFFEGKQVYSQ